MSRIITELTCSDCGYKRDVHLSFGHPEEDIDFEWTCENCAQNNVEIIKAWLPKLGAKCSDTVIYKENGFDSVYVFDSERRPIPLNSLKWKWHEDEEYNETLGCHLTLNDISEQLKAKRGGLSIGVVYVWVEAPLYGSIYCYGNYGDNEWYMHGKTQGYA